MRFHRNIHGCRRQLSTAQGAGATLTFMKVHLRVLLIYWLRVLTSRLKYAGLYPCSQLYIGNTQRYQLVLHRSLLVSIHLRIVALDVPAAGTCPPSGMKYSPKVGATTTVGANVSLSLLTEMDGGLITIGTRNAHCSGALTSFGVPIVGISMRSFKCTTNHIGDLSSYHFEFYCFPLHFFFSALSWRPIYFSWTSCLYRVLICRSPE